MIEKRVINGKEYWVDVIVNPDGSRVETIFGNPMQDLADTQAHAMEKVLETQRKKNQEEFDRQQDIITQRKLEEDYALQKKKEELEREIAQLEKKKIKSQPDYDPDDYDVMFAEDSFSLNATKEEYACYWYIKNDLLQDVCTRSDLNKMLESPNWKKVIWPKIQKENELEAQKKKELKELEQKKEKELCRLDKKIDREERIQKIIFVLVILLAAIACAVGVIVFNNWLVAIISVIIGMTCAGIMYKEWF